MKIKKKTVLNVLLILFVLSFFVTPLGHYAKVFLNRLVAFSPDPIEVQDRERIVDYDWELKDENWDFFNFDRSEGKVIFINFWASWKVPSLAELKSVEKLYDQYGDRVDFYIITNEEKEPVLEFMEKNGFHFPVTYLVIGNRSPVVIPEQPPFTYIIDKEGFIVVENKGVGNWTSDKTFNLMESLLAE